MPKKMTGPLLMDDPSSYSLGELLEFFGINSTNPSSEEVGLAVESALGVRNLTPQARGFIDKAKVRVEELLDRKHMGLDSNHHSARHADKAPSSRTEQTYDVPVARGAINPSQRNIRTTLIHLEERLSVPLEWKTYEKDPCTQEATTGNFATNSVSLATTVQDVLAITLKSVTLRLAKATNSGHFFVQLQDYQFNQAAQAVVTGAPINMRLENDKRIRWQVDYATPGRNDKRTSEGQQAVLAGGRDAPVMVSGSSTPVPFQTAYASLGGLSGSCGLPYPEQQLQFSVRGGPTTAAVYAQAASLQALDNPGASRYNPLPLTDVIACLVVPDSARAVGGQTDAVARVATFTGDSLVAAKREYFGPVDIGKFAVTILDDSGHPVELEARDDDNAVSQWALTMEAEQLYQY